MTAQLDIDRLLDDFLGEGTDQLSDHVLDAALGDIETTRQRRAWRVPRRYPTCLRHCGSLPPLPSWPRRWEARSSLAEI